jgi:hypothetical protein
VWIRRTLDLWVHVVLLDIHKGRPVLRRRHENKRGALDALHVSSNPEK